MKEPKQSSTVGTTLKSRRLARGKTLKEVELATRIRGKYLLAIEADDYAQLPHDVYTRGFVQSYARYLEVSSEDVLGRYDSQRGQQELQLKRTNSLRSRRLTLTPRLLTGVGGGLIALIVAGYLAVQLSSLTAAPGLEIKNPSKDQVVYGSLITIAGAVAGGADVFVNDSPILVDDSGNFSDAIALQDGVNSISVSAKNRLGKTTVVTRNILAHVPKVDPASSLPTATFDGVATSVQVQKTAATVTVLVDGKQSFKGTMLPGTTQTFKGANNVTISTTNAGATSLIVTNSQAAGKNIGTLGKSGQAKQGFTFDKDTQFQ